MFIIPMFGRWQSPHHCGNDTSASILYHCLVWYHRWSTCSVPFFEQFTNTLGTCASSSTTTQRHIWFICDRAPSHFLCSVRQHLDQTFSEQWMGFESPVSWRAWSLDLWWWGHLKTCIFSADQWLRGIKQWAENTNQEIWVKPGIFDRVCTSFEWRDESCVEMHGKHIEQLL